ncbi:MAG: glycosyltransferase family 4 protein [bacterium]|nr:glycosyltransferase family 4 protein [bacterium]
MGKIYIVSWNGTSIAGGVERVVKYIEDVLSAKHEVVIVCDNMLKENGLWGRWTVENRVIKAIGYSLYIAVHKKKKDYVISNGYQAPFIRADFLWAHGNMLENRRCIEKRSDYKKTKESVLERISAHMARNVVCVASHVKREYEKLYHVSPKKMWVLPNAVDSTRFYPMTERIEQEQLITVLYVGRLETGKGIKELLRLSSYIETLSGYRLMIVTQSERDRTRLFSNKQYTEVYSKVPIEKLNDYYNQADVFYLPSSYEGFEMVTLESLSAGVPVVGYRVGAINELSRKGQKGICVLQDNRVETAFAKLTEMALKYKRKEARRALHEDIQSRYGIGVFKRQLLDKVKLF